MSLFADPERRARVVALIRNGGTTADAAELIGCSRKTLSCAVNSDEPWAREWREQLEDARIDRKAVRAVIPAEVIAQTLEIDTTPEPTRAPPPPAAVSAPVPEPFTRVSSTVIEPDLVDGRERERERKAPRIGTREDYLIKLWEALDDPYHEGHKIALSKGFDYYLGPETARAIRAAMSEQTGEGSPVLVLRVPDNGTATKAIKA